MHTSNLYKRIFTTLSVSAMLLSTIAHASTVVFYETFDSVQSTRSTTGPQNANTSPAYFDNGWVIDNGSIDAIPQGDAGLSCLGGTGGCVDMDGSTGNAGRMTTMQFFGAGDYELSFFYSGNQRGGASDSFDVVFGDYLGDFNNIAVNQGWTNVVEMVTIGAGGSYLSFEDFGSDNLGFMLDEITVTDLNSVSAVPVPAAVWLFGSAIAGFAGFSRFKKKA